MINRSASVGAAAIGAFFLVLAALLAARMLAPQPAAETAIAPNAPQPVTASDGLDPVAVQALIAGRDQEYHSQLDEANRRIGEANTRLQEAYQQLAAAAPPATATPLPPTVTPAPTETAPPATATAPAGRAITAAIAAQIALNVAPGATLLAPPELVDLQGAVTYEVRLDAGSIYIDAGSGKILYNGTVAPAAVSANVPVTGAGERREYEEEGDDGD